VSSRRRTLVVSLKSADRSKMVDLDQFGRDVLEVIARKEGEGWRLVSSNVLTLRQTGTVGNVLLQSGGQFATQLGAVIVFQSED
jgi:hypothetical protein